jgi:hypothetical protein
MKSILTLLLFATSFFGISQFTEIDKVIGSYRAEDNRFGQAVAITDHFAMIGAYGYDEDGPNRGALFVFEKQGLNWVETQLLTNSDHENYDRFGWSVAIDGNYMVVGAIGEDDDLVGSTSMSKSGAAYIFENQGGTWVEIQKIIASDRSIDDEFGWSVDIDGNTIIVGAHQDFEDVNGLNPIHHAGSVYIFEKNISGVWNQTQKIVASGRAPDLYYPNGHVGEDLSDQFGHSVGISGDYIVIGALNHDWDPTNTTSTWQTGAAYIFEKSGSIWTEVQKIRNSDNLAGVWERFGSDVAIDSNIIAVGVWSQDYSITGTDHMKNAGAVYTFIRDAGGTWNENQKITAGSRNTGDHFGWDVKINDGFLISGVEHDDHDENETNPLNEAGSAYIFEKNAANQFIQINKIIGSDRDSLDIFGYAVDIYGTDVVVGAFQHDFNTIHADSINEAGAAYIFSSDPCPTQYYSNTIEICNGDSYSVSSSTYTSTGTYTDVLTSILTGCDSSITTNLTVLDEIFLNQTVSICTGETYTVGTSNYNTSGNFADVLVSSLTGCDSTVNTNLSIIQPIIMNENVTICASQDYTVGTSIYTISGIFIDTITSINTGCDSIINTNLTVLAPIELNQEISICFGNSYTIGASNYTVSGSYSDVLTASNGCDSTINTVLTVIPSIIVNQMASICDGDSYTVGTSIYTVAGSFTDILTSVNGCDSTVHTEITLTTEFIISQNITICYGETYTIGTNTYSTPGNYTDTLVMVTSSCDSIVHTALTVNLPIDLSLDLDNNTIESNQNNSFYQWVNCDDSYSYVTNTISNEQDIELVATGNYAVIINNNNCVDTSACVYMDYVGLNETETNYLVTIYPNPSNGQFTISSNIVNDFTVRINNSIGEVVYSGNTPSTNQIVDISFLPKGMYFIELKFENKIITQKYILN